MLHKESGGFEVLNNSGPIQTLKLIFIHIALILAINGLRQIMLYLKSSFSLALIP